jgi:hypothetical protein
MLSRTPQQKVSVFVQCPACVGVGRVYVDSPSEPSHVGSPVVCRGCFGSGRLELRVSEQTEDTLWEEALATLEMVDIAHDPEVIGFVQIDGAWICDEDLPSHRIARSGKVLQ